MSKSGVVNIKPEQLDEVLESMSDEDLAKVAFMIPWVSEPGTVRPSTDSDGFPTLVNMTDFANFDKLQLECWNKFVQNPQINSYIRDYQGRLTGHGFSITSEIPEIQECIDEEMEDARNDLFTNLPKYVGRSETEGELFLCLTIHGDSFVEVDFLEPSALKGGGDNNSGIIFHPHKPTMPLMYLYDVKSPQGSETIPIPSINLAYYPDLINIVRKHKSYRGNASNMLRKRGKKYRDLGGFNRFIVAWDRSLITKRNVSHIRTTIEWINHYETLKKYEIDHKKSSGAYLWVAKIEDPKAYRTWLSMTDDQKKKTGLLQKKTPGGTIVLPPGMALDVINPDLPKISDQDTDILRMVISGLNRPEDVITGQTSGSTYASIKSSRGPMSDRTKDDIAYFERFMRFHLWKGIFFLKNKVNPSFKTEYKVKEAVGYNEGGEKKPKMKDVTKQAYKLVNFTFPVSEINDVEGIARAYLGVKHGSVIDTLGIPAELVAEKLGFTGWKKLRLQRSTEDELYPELIQNADAEMVQENQIEPARSTATGNNKKTTKKTATNNNKGE